MDIRTATIQDAERLVEIYSYYVEHTAITFEYETPSVTEFASRIENTLKKYPYIVIEDEGKILGYAYAGPFKTRAAYDWSCELSIYLEYGQQRKGYGRALYEELTKRLKAQGILNLYACIADPPVEDEYLTKDSERFHKRLGFTKVGTFHQCGKKFGRWYDMIWMEKMIGDHICQNQS